MQPTPIQDFPSIADPSMIPPPAASSTAPVATTSVETSGDLAGIRRGLGVIIAVILVSIVGLVKGFSKDGGSGTNNFYLPI